MSAFLIVIADPMSVFLIVIKKADIGLATVILFRADYITEVRRQLN